MTAAFLGGLWVVLLLIPAMSWVTTGDAPTGAPAIVGLSLLAVTALAAGFVLAHADARRWVLGAVIFGTLTAGAAATASVLASQSEDAVPWGAVVVINFLVSGGLTATLVEIGAAAGRRTRPPGHRTVP